MNNGKKKPVNSFVVILAGVALLAISICLGIFAIRWSKTHCLVAPCIYADEYGVAGILLDGGELPAIEMIFVNVTDGGTLIHFYGGYELAELTAVETAEWNTIVYRHNGEPVLICVRTETLSREQIERLRNLTVNAFNFESESSMNICDAGETIMGNPD